MNLDELAENPKALAIMVKLMSAQKKLEDSPDIDTTIALMEEMIVIFKEIKQLEEKEDAS